MFFIAGFAHSGASQSPFALFKPLAEDPQPPWRRFLELLFPILAEWPDLSAFRRVIAIFSVPLHFIFAFTVPIVDYIETDEERRTGYFSWWSKHLLALNLLVDPLFIAWGVGGVGAQWGSFPAWALCLIIGVVASLVSLLVTNNEHPPKYYQLLAPLSFLTSVFWIYFLAGELVSLIEVIGVVFGVSETLLGLTVLAWGNSIGGLRCCLFFRDVFFFLSDFFPTPVLCHFPDLISNTTMARLGFANMGVSACFGSPLLSTTPVFLLLFLD